MSFVHWSLEFGVYATKKKILALETFSTCPKPYKTLTSSLAKSLLRRNNKIDTYFKEIESTYRNLML